MTNMTKEKKEPKKVKKVDVAIPIYDPDYADHGIKDSSGKISK